MTKISQYSTDVNITGNDKWIGSDAQNYLITKNFTPNNLAVYFNGNNVIDIGTSIRYMYQTLDPGELREQGTISFETEIGPQVNFSDITTFLIARNTLKGNNVTDYLDFLVDSKVLLSKASNINIFGYYKITSIEPWIPNTNFLVVTVEFLSGNGFIYEDLDYLVSLVDKVQETSTTIWGTITGNILNQTDLISYLSSNYFPIPTGTTLQYLRGDGSLATFPTVPVVVPSALTKVDDTNVTLTLGGYPSLSLLEPVTLTLGWIGTLADNRIASASIWNAKQNALSGTGIVKSTGGTISYINGTSTEYVRGDGTLANFPSVATPTLQQVTTAGNVTTNTMIIGGGSLPGDTTMFLGTSVQINVLNSTGGYSNLAWLSPTAGLLLKTNSNPGFFSSILKSDLITGTDKTFQFPNNSGTLALLSDIPTVTLQTAYNNSTPKQIITLGEFNPFTLTNDTSNNYKVLSIKNILGVEKLYIQSDGYLVNQASIASYTSMISSIFEGGDGVTFRENLGNTRLTAFGNTGASTNRWEASNKINYLADYSAYYTSRSLIDKGYADATYVPTSRTLTINGTTYDLSANRSWTIATSGGTVTSVGLSMPSAFTVTNSPVTNAGTLTVTGAGLVSQYVRGDGTLANFPVSTGGGASLSFYLNGSVSQGTFGGVAFKKMDRTPVLGAGTDFTINANGYIQSFITDANVPNQLEIPAGNWNFETYFSANNGGGSPTFYVELYKWNGTTLSLIASNSSSPEGITNGTAIDLYVSALAVPQTTLLATDRLAVRIYVNHSGRTITLHTEDNHLCQVITTFSTGITALNGLTTQVQNLAAGTSGTDFAISSSGTTHTFNLPTASASNTGKLSSADWSTFNTAYIDRLKWDGGATGLVAATGRTSLGLGTFATSNYPTWASGTPFVKMTAAGTFALDTNTYLTTAVTSVSGTGTVAGLTLTGTVTSTGNLTLGGTLSTPVSTINDSTTVGQNFVKLTNPSAITFIRINADNSISTLDASTFRTAIGAGTSSTNGTVTSVSALTLGTTGTDLSSTVATGTTTPVITLNVPDASATARGVITTGTQTIAGAKTFSTAPILSSLTASQLLALDGSKNIQTLDTATYPSLTELARVKGVTSAIQTQLDSKQPTLSYTPYRNVQTSQSAISGIVAETIVFTATIPAGAFNSSDVIKVLFGANKTTATSTYTLRLRVNTTNTISGASTIARYDGTATAQMNIMTRSFNLNGGNLYGLAAGNSSLTDIIASGTGLNATTLNPANIFYIFATVQLANASDSIIGNMLSISN